MALIFENETCGRCGGTGNYSFNQMHGTVCYGCNGSKVKLTARGQAAQDYFTKLCSKPYAELQPGEKILEAAMGSYKWRTVQSVTIRQSDTRMTIDGVEQPPRMEAVVDCEGLTLHTDPAKLARVAHTKEAKAVKVAEALAYQATLTKQGKPAKK